MQKNSAEEAKRDGKTPRREEEDPSPDKQQGIANRNAREENARQAKVIPFRDKRKGNQGTERGKK